MGEPGVGRMRDRLLLYSGIYRNPFEIFGVDRPGAVGHREALLQQRDDLLLTQPLAPARERRAIKWQLVPEHHLPTEVLEIRVLHPSLAQRLVGEVVHMLENEQPGHQPRRQRRLPGSHPTHRAEASRQTCALPISRQPHQRMAKVDDLLERRAKQVVLAIVARLAHRSPPTANLAVEGITDRPKRESQTARKPACIPGFLAKLITCSGQIIAIDQSLPNSSRTTRYRALPAGGRPVRQGSKMAWINIELVVAQNPPSRKEMEQVLSYLARKAKARFYADENFPAEAVTLLRAMGAKVQTASTAGLMGRSDEDHVAYARENGLVLLTCDRDFLNGRRFPLIQSPAIFVFDFWSGSLREMKQSFRCLATV